MKKEIKFRGKRIDNGEWIYGYYSERVIDHIKGSYIRDAELCSWFEVDPKTVGQFTGKKDKNDVDIYDNSKI